MKFVSLTEASTGAHRAQMPDGFSGRVHAGLKRGALVCDGAMGTELYAQGVPLTACFEWLCCSEPERVAQIHHAFVAAGAGAITTNSFGANRYRLARHGLAAHAVALNVAAGQVARRVASDKVLVLGSMGPTGLSEEQAGAEGPGLVGHAFGEQAGALWSAGVDGLMLETFCSMRELELAIGAVRSQLSTVPLLACISFDSQGTTADGFGPEQVAECVAARGVDGLGVNCGDGPASALQMLRRMAGPGLPLVARPNAGVPKRSHGDLAYDWAPADFGRYAARLFASGAAVVGGCCGTTPQHIRAVAATARDLRAEPGGTPCHLPVQGLQRPPVR